MSGCLFWRANALTGVPRRGLRLLSAAAPTTATDSDNRACILGSLVNEMRGCNSQG